MQKKPLETLDGTKEILNQGPLLHFGLPLWSQTDVMVALLFFLYTRQMVLT